MVYQRATCAFCGKEVAAYYSNTVHLLDGRLMHRCWYVIQFRPMKSRYSKTLALIPRRPDEEIDLTEFAKKGVRNFRLILGGLLSLVCGFAGWLFVI